MDGFNALKKIIRDSVKEHLEQLPSGEYYCYLHEIESDYRCKVTNIPLDTLVIKCDSFPCTDSFFNSNDKECKRADYILISAVNKVISIIELKNSKESASNTDITAQLKGARCIVEYCDSIISQFLNVKDGLSGYSYKFYKYHNQVRKRAFHNKTHLSNSKPENAKLLSGTEVHYNSLTR